MTKRRRKAKPEDQYGFITKHEKDPSGSIEFTTTEHGRIRMSQRRHDSFLDSDEAYETIRAMVRVGACQFGGDWLERVQRYVGMVKVIE